MIDEPWGAFTCRSSTLTVLADSSSFPGLLLTVLGPRVVSMINELRGAFTCRSSTLMVLADSGPFRVLVLTVLGSQIDFNGCQTPRCLRVGHQQSQFGPILARFLDYYSILGSRSDLHD